MFFHIQQKSLPQSIFIITTGVFFGCQSPESTEHVDKSVTLDSSALKHTNKVEKTSPDSQILFFDTTLTFQELKKEIEDYADTIVNNVPPKPCKEYVLRAVTGVRGITLEKDSSLYKHTLCEDIIKFENINKAYLKKVLAEKETYGSWHFTFTPVGEKYYIIKGVQMVNAIREVEYYYQRKE